MHAPTLKLIPGRPAMQHFPPSGQALAHLVIAPAMAVSQRFYRDFAQYMAQQGFAVTTFDYLGMGEAGGGELRACRADISEWIEKDADAVLQSVHQAAHGAPVFLLGHSLGGQVAPLLPSQHLLAGVVNIAVGSGHASHNRPDVARRAPLLWHVLTPLLCPLFGYFPGKRIGVMGDIPKQAFYQWRRWCLSPEYVLSGEPGAREAYARAAWPVLGLTFTDDELLNEAGSRLLHGAYRSGRVDYREIGPQQYKLARIGHFGFFKDSMRDSLWPLVVEWLRAQLQAPRA
ncbi:alpha/beta fold hydrolase [Massilia sp. W12]|uniref:alpha/beta hydrolase family protein n=1 Tax=Massilia sp. W12 TaxID=3126507 RepID=UPI0030D37DD2